MTQVGATQWLDYPSNSNRSCFVPSGVGLYIIRSQRHADTYVTMHKSTYSNTVYMCCFKDTVHNTSQYRWSYVSTPI